MKRIEWNEEKNRHLKVTRGISFEEITCRELVDIIRHPARIDQWLYIYVLEDYCWVLPCVVDEDRIFFKTAYPSRKFTREYLRKELP